MKLFSLVFFFLNLALFVLFTVLSAARYIVFPGIWNRMLRHPVQSLYLGTFPMGATTLFTVSINVIYDTYNFGGRPFVYAIWAFWWLDVAISILCCWGIVHIMSVISRGLGSRTHSQPIKDHASRTYFRIYDPHLAASRGDPCRWSIHRGNHCTSSHAILAERWPPHSHFLGVYGYYRIGTHHDAPHRIPHSHHCVWLFKGTWHSVYLLPIRTGWAGRLCDPPDRLGIQINSAFNPGRNRRIAGGIKHRRDDQCNMRRDRLCIVVL